MTEKFNCTTGHEWVIHIKQTLDEGIDIEEDVGNIPVCIFNVPKALISNRPEAYIPQLVAIGPHHHRRLELFEMERYKLILAERIQKKFHKTMFSDIVGHVEENVDSIRACYHDFLDFDREELGWTFAIDASFLLVYLQIDVTSCLEQYLVDFTKKKTIRQEILRDIVMLENQIPLFVLRAVNRFFQHENPDEVLALMLMKFGKHLCPIKIRDGQQHVMSEECLQKDHLLDLLYCMVAPKFQHEIVEIEENKESKESHEEIGFFKRTLKAICRVLYFITIAPILFLIQILKSKPVQVVITLPWQVIKHLFHSKTETEITNLVSTAETVAEEVDENVEEFKDESPLIEKILIPSATKLSGIGVKFIPTNGGLKTISFDKPSATFYLPVVDLDDNSEVLLRNLVAYEACLAPEFMEFTRYIELMKGILDTKEDVKILRDSGIVLSRLKSDEEATNLWQGMTKFVKLTTVPILDKAIENANAYYSKNWKVRVAESFEKYIYSSWPILTFLAANALILLSALQALCSVYNCSKWVGNHAADRVLQGKLWST